MNYKDLTFEELEKAIKEYYDMQPKTRQITIYPMGQGAIDLYNEAMKKAGEKFLREIENKFGKSK
jgi:hypothetical protein